MELTKTNTGNPIRGRVVPTASQRADCQAVMAQLTFADMGRGAGTLHTVGTARLDMQGHTATGVNLQVQIGGQTAATALVANTVLKTVDPMNQKGVNNSAISVLNQSLDSGTIWSLTGTLPKPIERPLNDAIALSIANSTILPRGTVMSNAPTNLESIILNNSVNQLTNVINEASRTRDALLQFIAMNKYVAYSDLSILDASVNQITHFVTAAHRTQSANLLGANFIRLAPDDAPAGTPSTTDLNNILNNAVTAPSTTSIATVPTTPDTDMYKMLGQVQTLDSYISLLTAFCVYNEHPAPYDITKPDEASAFTRAMAKWRNYVITGGAVKAMAGYLPVSEIVAQSYSKSVTSAELHLEFLGELFGGFSLPTAAMAELDSILTKVVASLGQLNLSFETQSSTLDHFLTYYYFATVPGTGGDNQPPAMYICKVRTFFLHIDQSAWKAAVGKSSVSHFTFEMNYFDMDTTMDGGLVGSDMAAISSTIQTLTGKTAAEVNTLMNMQAIHADPQKA